jgi:hypothetical protein
MAKKVRLANTEERRTCVSLSHRFSLSFPFEVFTVGTFISLKCYAASTFFLKEIFKYLSQLSSFFFGVWFRLETNEKNSQRKTFIIILIL